MHPYLMHYTQLTPSQDFIYSYYQLDINWQKYPIDHLHVYQRMTFYRFYRCSLIDHQFYGVGMYEFYLMAIVT